VDNNDSSSRRPPGTLGGTFDEMRAGVWRANARHRASRRKSAWNLLLPVIIFPTFIVLWGTGAIVFQVGSLFAGVTAAGPHKSLLSFLIFGPLVLPSISFACVIGNFVVFRIPAARRAMDAEDQGFPGTDYATAQKALSKAAWISFSAAVLLALIGIVASR
jgi:hypothetical protein